MVSSWRFGEGSRRPKTLDSLSSNHLMDLPVPFKDKEARGAASLMNPGTREDPTV
jgi:hypothetical protein